MSPYRLARDRLKGKEKGRIRRVADWARADSSHSRSPLSLESRQRDAVPTAGLTDDIGRWSYSVHAVRQSWTVLCIYTLAPPASVRPREGRLRGDEVPDVVGLQVRVIVLLVDLDDSRIVRRVRTCNRHRQLLFRETER